MDALINGCGEFRYKKQRYWVWNEFKELCPFFAVVAKGSNLSGRNTAVRINDTTIRKLLAYVSDEVLVQQMVPDAASGGTSPEWIAVDLENLQNYVNNAEHDLKHNAAGKSSEWVDKIRRNAIQAQIVHRIATSLGGAFPQYPKPSIFGRIYYHGLSIQTMSKQVRAAVLGEHYQYDLSAAIYGIKLAIISGIVAKPKERHVEYRYDGLFTYTKEYLREKDAIRKRLADQCLTDTPMNAAGKLGLVKRAITAIGFGAKTDAALWYDGHTPAIAQIIMNKADRDRFLKDKFVANFTEEQDDLTDAIVHHLKRVGEFDPIKQAIKDAKHDKRITDAHILAYARVSTTDQSLEVQMDELGAHGCERIFQDQASGTSRARAGLVEMLQFVRDGDTIVVNRLDRFARSLTDLFQLLDELSRKGVAFQCVHQSIDTSCSTGKLTLAILGAVAEFENDIRRERQRAGIAKAKANGLYKGRKAGIDAVRVKEMAAQGVTASAIANELGCHRQSVYRILN